MKKMLAFTFVCTALSLWVGCGDDGSNSTDSNANVPQGGNEIACDEVNEGLIIKPVDSEYPRLCQNGSWIEQIIESSSSVDSESSSSANVIPSSSAVVILDPDPESSSSVEAKSSSSVEESSSSTLIDDLSYSSEEGKVFLCEDGETYVVDLENCDKEIVSSSSITPSSSSVIPSSSSIVIPDAESSSSNPESSSSQIASSSSEQSSSSINESSSSTGIPSKLFDCNEYNCVTTKYLNPEIDYGELLDERDNQVYRTVQIGEQVWMAQNLNYAYTGVEFRYTRAGYSYVSDSTSWCYGNDPANCDKYGRLYTWSAVMDSAAQFSINANTKCGYGKTCTPNSPHRGICPEGWHIPTYEEYNVLHAINNGSVFDAGTMFNSTSGWNSADDNGNDKYGFSVLPASFRNWNGAFEDEGDVAYMWSATNFDNEFAFAQDHGSGKVSLSEYSKYNGRSLRCLKD